MFKTKCWHVILLRLSGGDILTFLVRGEKLYFFNVLEKIQISSSPSFYVFTYFIYKVSIRIVNQFLLLLTYALHCNIFNSFCAMLYLHLWHQIHNWQHIKGQMLLLLQRYYNHSLYAHNVCCQICFPHTCTICVIQCVFHAWITLAFPYL